MDEAQVGDWREDARFLGPADAPVLLVEYSSFICGYCGRHARDTLPPLIRSFVETGAVRYEFRDLPLPGDVGRESAIAARCAHEQGSFWEMHQQLFHNQAFLRAREWDIFADEINLDISKFNACMARPDHDDAIQADVASAYEAAAFGTPTFFLGPNQPGELDLFAMQRIKGSESYVFFATEIGKLLQPE